MRVSARGPTAAPTAQQGGDSAPECPTRRSRRTFLLISASLSAWASCTPSVVASVSPARMPRIPCASYTARRAASPRISCASHTRRKAAVASSRSAGSRWRSGCRAAASERYAARRVAPSACGGTPRTAYRSGSSALALHGHAGRAGRGRATGGRRGTRVHPSDAGTGRVGQREQGARKLACSRHLRLSICLSLLPIPPGALGARACECAHAPVLACRIPLIEEALLGVGLGSLAIRSPRAVAFAAIFMLVHRRRGNGVAPAGRHLLVLPLLLLLLLLRCGPDGARARARARADRAAAPPRREATILGPAARAQRGRRPRGASAPLPTPLSAVCVSHRSPPRLSPPVPIKNKFPRISHRNSTQKRVFDFDFDFDFVSASWGRAF